MYLNEPEEPEEPSKFFFGEMICTVSERKLTTETNQAVGPFTLSVRPSLSGSIASSIPLATLSPCLSLASHPDYLLKPHVARPFSVISQILQGLVFTNRYWVGLGKTDVSVRV